MTGASWSTAAIAAGRLDVGAASLIRVNRRAARLDDHGFATHGRTGCRAAGFRSTAQPPVARKKPGFRQASHTHCREHSTSHLDPSHRAKYPFLGNLELGSSRPMERRQSVSRGIPGSCCSPPATRVAVQAAVADTPFRSLRPSNVRPSTDSSSQ